MNYYNQQIHNTSQTLFIYNFIPKQLLYLVNTRNYKLILSHFKFKDFLKTLNFFKNLYEVFIPL